MSDLDALLHQLSDPSGLAWNEETYDLALARGLSPADRTVYVGKLIANAQIGDTRALLTLGHLQAGEALAMLQAAGQGSDPWAPTARRALVLLGHGAEVVSAIAHDAVHAPAEMARVAAVMDLPRIGGAAAIAALQQALSDESDAVRMLAWDGLIEVFDLGRLIRGPDGKPALSTEIELFQVLLSADLPAFIRMGVDGMRALTDRLRSGASPQALGIAWQPNPAPEVFDRLRAALFDLDAAYPVDDIARLTGIARRWAEAMIALRLPHDDPRVPAALVRLSARWTSPALDEVARSPDSSAELRAELTHAVNALR